MAHDAIQVALDSINKIVFKICITSIIIILIIVTGFCSILIYNTSKSYDYEGYPDTDIVNTNTSNSGIINDKED